jgi:two-component system response regulator AlgR
MKILIVDDEAPARARLRRILEEMEDCRVSGEAANGREALQLTANLQPDILLMDIRMPEMDGLEAAQHLQSLGQPPAVIFTTAYNDYAVRAFETHAVDYLLKPVRRERLADALLHARLLTRMQTNALRETSATPVSRQRICASVRGGLQLIEVDDIRYFQADQKYVSVVTAEGEVLIEETLKALEEEFADRFVRIHRNALVARRYIEGLMRNDVGNGCVRLSGVTSTLEVSRRHIAEIRRLVKALQG